MKQTNSNICFAKTENSHSDTKENSHSDTKEKH